MADLFRQRNSADVAELLECANAHFDQTDQDNWSGGTLKPRTQAENLGLYYR